jgi:hypothetical protein
MKLKTVTRTIETKQVHVSVFELWTNALAFFTRTGLHLYASPESKINDHSAVLIEFHEAVMLNLNRVYERVVENDFNEIDDSDGEFSAQLSRIQKDLDFYLYNRSKINYFLTPQILAEWNPFDDKNESSESNELIVHSRYNFDPDVIAHLSDIKFIFPVKRPNPFDNQ